MMNLVFRKNKKSLSEILTNGVLLVMAAFYVVSMFFDKPQWTLASMSESGNRGIAMVGWLCFLICFLGGLWRLGNQLFEKKDELITFVLITAGLYWMTTFRSGQSEATAIFSSSWNGLTVLSCFVMPVTFCICLGWMKEAESCDGITGVVEKIFLVIVLLLAGQFTDEKGGFYIALMLLVTVAVIIVRKGYDYVITAGRFKKRI